MKKFRWLQSTLKTVLATCLLAVPLLGTQSQEQGSRTSKHRTVRRAGEAAALILVQGRVTEVHDTMITVKTPDGAPGGEGIHPMYVTSGPTFQVDVSRARFTLPDGKQLDTKPLSVGEHVVMALAKPKLTARNRDTIQTYLASVVERVAPGDSIVTH